MRSLPHTVASRWRQARRPGLVALSVLCAASVAAAEPDTKANAETLFNELSETEQQRAAATRSEQAPLPSSSPASASAPTRAPAEASTPPTTPTTATATAGGPSTLEPTAAKESAFTFDLLPIADAQARAAGDTQRRLSLHLLGAVLPSLRGFEVAGVFNVERDGVDGAQLAGAFNFAGATVEGVQLAGSVNFAGGDFAGLQAATSLNVVGGGALRPALQAAGGLNVVGGAWRGAQLAGGLNYAAASSGAQVAGGLNIAGSAAGAQVAGGLNIASDVSGAQLAGALNIASVLSGAQLAGAVNIAGSVSGAQLAGGLNIAGHVSGLQLAPFNLATGEVDGAQVGVLNLASNASAAIGILSVMWAGRWELEASGAETGLSSLSVRNAARYTHSIVRVGAGNKRGTPRLYSFGYGLGAQIALAESFGVDLDGIAQSIVEPPSRTSTTSWHTLRTAGLGTARALATWQVFSWLGIYAGPTYNALISRSLSFDHFRLVGRDTALDNTRGHLAVYLWPGVEAGIRIRLH